MRLITLLIFIAGCTTQPPTKEVCPAVKWQGTNKKLSRQHVSVLERAQYKCRQNHDSCVAWIRYFPSRNHYWVVCARPRKGPRLLDTYLIDGTFDTGFKGLINY